MTKAPSHRTAATEPRAAAARMARVLGLGSSAAGVRLLSDDDALPAEAMRLGRRRYCQTILLARRGRDVLLDGEGISCPAAAAAFGFRSLLEGLAGDKGLIGFGIVSDHDVGRRLFKGMSILI